MLSGRFVPVLGLAAVAAMMAATPALASVTVLGGGMGQECYYAAEFKRDLRSGLEICNKALDEDLQSRRDRAATLVNRGIIYMQSRDISNALKDYEAAIRLHPKLAEAHVNYGIALLHSGGRDQAAIEALSRGIDMNTARLEVALYTRAVAHEVAGNLRAAYEDYQAAAAAKPDWQEPVEQLKRFTVERRPTSNG